MLKDRVKVTETGIQIFREQNTDYELYYGEFKLKDEPGVMPALLKANYWNPAIASEIVIKKPNCYLVIVEKNGDSIMEEYRFFYSTSRGKSELSISIKPKRRYGKNAQLITIEWIDCKAESIHNQYIYLADRNGEKYHFLQELIQPLEPDGRKQMDQYVFVVPDGQKAEDYYVEVDPLIRQKYSIVD